jgi:hypothetical protein
MPLEFALRPRIKIAEGFAPPRRPRWRLPKLVLPVALYWLTAGGITYGLIRAHAEPSAPQAVAVPAPTHQPWWPEPSARSTSAPLEAVPLPTAPAFAAPEPSSTSESASDTSETGAEDPLSPTAANRDDTQASRVSKALRGEREADDDLGETSDIRLKSRPLRDTSAGPPVRDQSGDARSQREVAVIDSLAPPPRDVTPLLGAPPPDAPSAVANALPSCEAAAASANQELDLAHQDRTPDLSREAIASVLDNGVWIARCDIPMTTSVDLCVAIRAGKVIGASVLTRPASATINACVKRRAAGLSFPYSARVDVAKTQF